MTAAFLLDAGWGASITKDVHVISNLSLASLCGRHLILDGRRREGTVVEMLNEGADNGSPEWLPAQIYIVWLTIDSLRYDYTSLADYQRDTTSNLQQIADRSSGNSFSRCFAHAGSTEHSVPAFLTGTWPSRNVVGFNNESIPESIPTVAERFRNAGYTTAAVSEIARVSSAIGLDRGFDDFHIVPSMAKGKKNLKNYIELSALLNPPNFRVSGLD